MRDLAFGIFGALTTVGASRTAAQPAIEFVDALGDGPLATTYAIPEKDGALIDRKNEVILVRWQNAIYAFNLSCPHQNTALKWNEKDMRFKCPKHNSRYQPDGLFIDGRATRGMDRFSVTVHGTNVVVDVNTMHKQDADPAGWAAAMAKLPPA